MSNWTTTALAALENYLEKNRATLVMAGGDADEVVGDLRRHVEAEVAALNLAVVTEQDVNRILARLGPVREESTAESSPSTEEKKSKFSLLGTVFLLIFGFILPTLTFGIELGTHMCATEFFDPFPTWVHVFLVALVPVSNLIIWRNFTGLSPRMAQLLWVSNGAAFGVSLFYALIFLPMSPFALIGILVIGLGFLPLSPLLSMICVLFLRRRLRRSLLESGYTKMRHWGLAALIAVSLLTLFAVRVPLTNQWINQAGSDSPAESLRAIQMLRRFGSDDVLLKQCYGKAEQLTTFWRQNVDSSLAQSVYFRVNGTPYNAVPPPLSKYQRNGRTDVFDEFDWDTALGGETVSGQVKGLSISASRMDGLCKAEEGWGYIEWIMEFRNEHPRSQREARAQIQLPPGGVVSRLTLWVNGEEREAAFAGRGDVRQAYEKVAIQERRDPVLVTTSGPDRVLMQCFPVQPNGGTMKVRIGITAPLFVEKDKAALRLPRFLERNFRVSQSFEHSLWLESSLPASAQNKKLQTNASEGGKSGIRGMINDEDLRDPNSVLWFQVSSEGKAVYALDRSGTEKSVIKQTVESAEAKTPGRVAIVLDGSTSMTKVFPKIAKALDGMPSQVELSIWLARDGLQKIYDSSSQQGESASSIVGRLDGIGGQDDIPGLLQAWDWASAKPDGVVLWIHGVQPMLLSSLEALQQRTDWQKGNGGPTILDVAVEAGPNRISEKLSTTSALKGILRLGLIQEDLARLFGLWSHRLMEFRFVRNLDGANETSVSKSKGGSSHIVRLWAAQEIQRLVGERKVTDAIKLAGIYHLVTSVSGAVVLETKQQFEAAGLVPVDPNQVPMVVPEPSTWALFVIGFLILLFRNRFFRLLRRQNS